MDAEHQKRGFAFAYKSNSYEIDLAAHPWPAQNR